MLKKIKDYLLEETTLQDMAPCVYPRWLAIVSIGVCLSLVPIMEQVIGTAIVLGAEIMEKYYP